MNPGLLNADDVQSYRSKKQLAFCYKLDNGLTLCGPNLPSSGTICLAQALIIYEHILKKFKICKFKSNPLNFRFYILFKI